MSAINELKADRRHLPVRKLTASRKGYGFRFPNGVIKNLPFHPDFCDLAIEQLRDGTIVLHPQARATPWALTEGGA